MHKTGHLRVWIYTNKYIITKPKIMIIFGCVKVNACTNTNDISKLNKKDYKTIYSKDVLRHSIYHISRNFREDLILALLARLLGLLKLCIANTFHLEIM